MTREQKTSYVVEAGVIAAFYVVLMLVGMEFGMTSGAVQVRVAEALCILPCFTAAAVPGLFVGCLIGNILTGSVIWDVIFGSLATLLAAFLTLQFKNKRFLASLPPILVNMFVIPLVLTKAGGIDKALGTVAMGVGLGEFISAGILGQIVYAVLDKNRFVFKSQR
ncbi:MAG: QueT transporter family protein [Bacillota bacterium]|nr:QueT transporter family protein [Bacillota bacterium]